jgi:hypothetical protein
MDDCKRQVLSFLDAWYADFNLLFTFDRPPSGDYYKIVVTNDGNWCPRDRVDGGFVEDGVAFLSGSCNDIPGFAGYAFGCGTNAHDCATLIAHEHAHMVTLEHTDSITDIMHPTVLPTAAGFDNKDNDTVNDQPQCNRPTQNSHQVMLEKLGAWPGGTKPSPLPHLPDAGAPDLAPDLAPDDTVDSPPTGGSVGNLPTEIDGGGGVAVLPGFDAIVRPPLPTVEPSGNKPSVASHGGCSMAPARPCASTSAVVLLVVLALVARRFGLHGSAAGSHRAPAAPAARRPQSRHFLA